MLGEWGLQPREGGDFHAFRAVRAIQTKRLSTRNCAKLSRDRGDLAATFSLLNRPKVGRETCSPRLLVLRTLPLNSERILLAQPPRNVNVEMGNNLESITVQWALYLSHDLFLGDRVEKRLLIIWEADA